MIRKVALRILILGFAIFASGCTNNYEEGVREYKAEDYERALMSLKRVDPSDVNYDSAQIKIAEIEEILTRLKIEEQRQDSLAIIEKELKETEDFKAQLNGEIESLKTFDGSQYRDEISSIQIEIALFVTWANMIEKAAAHSDKQINKLGKTLETKIIALQKAEFPRLRKAYGEILKDKLWTENIEVATKGNGHTTLEFVGALFASNKNKQDTQQMLSEMLHLLRFKRTNYKWYKYDEEYTYYSMTTKRDGELVKL